MRTFFRHALCVASLFVATSATATDYVFSLLPSLGGASSSAVAINNLGQIVGSGTLQADNATPHAILWSGGVAMDLIGGPNVSRATGINNLGQVVGAVGPGAGTAFLWTPDGSAALLDTPVGFSSQAHAINDQGTIVGSRAAAGGTSKAVVWVGGVGTELSRESAGQSSNAFAVNSSGQIAGLLNTFPLQYTAVVWDGTTGRTSLGTGWTAYDINDSSIAVGTTVSRGGLPTHAMIWNGTSSAFLPGAENTGIQSAAQAINNASQVVGTLNNIPVLWSGGTATALTALPGVIVDDNWQLRYVSDINERGDMVGTAFNPSTGETRGYLLAAVPVPEPATVLLMSLGLVLVARAASSRARRAR